MVLKSTVEKENLKSVAAIEMIWKGVILGLLPTEMSGGVSRPVKYTIYQALICDEEITTK